MTKKIVIIDSDEKEVNELSLKINKVEGFEVVGCFIDVDRAIEFLKVTDVDLVISDVILQNSDGVNLLKQLKIEFGSVWKFKVLILSAVSGDSFVKKVMSLGASYYMLKPYKFDILIERIKEILEDFDMVQDSVAKSRSSTIVNLDSRLSNIFITVGIPAHIKGYQFLREAIKMAIDTPDIINSITKKLYPNIAKKFDTSSSKVERAIRHAIEVAWNRGKIENINNLFGVKVYSNNEKPTNGEFIALVADKMLIEGA